jgi:hypothetical protein
MAEGLKIEAEKQYRRYPPARLRVLRPLRAFA